MKLLNLSTIFLCSTTFGATSGTFTFTSDGESATAISSSFDFSNSGNSFFSGGFTFSKPLQAKTVTEVLQEQEEDFFEVDTFGFLFRYEGTPWCYHIKWGQIYLVDDGDSFWFYVPSVGWHWTSLGNSGVYPMIYSKPQEWWLYQKSLSTRDWIYRYKEDTWTTLDQYLGLE